MKVAIYGRKINKQSSAFFLEVLKHIDDFGWKDPKNMHPVNSPQLAVEVFNTMYGDYYSVIFYGYQVVFVKK